MLLTHSAPALMKLSEDQETKQTHVEPGQLTVWRWLGIDRFFPVSAEPHPSQGVLRGCASVSRIDCLPCISTKVEYRIIKKVASDLFYTFTMNTC
jgi:hypothetical protein